MDTLTIAIPAFNEEESIIGVATKALKAASAVAKEYEILLVDDGSTDKTGMLCDKLAKQSRHIRVIHHKKNKGFSGAITSCYRNASKDLIFLMPADGQIDADDCKRFMDKIASADVVVGYRTKSHESPLRKFNSMIFHLLFRILFGIPLREISTSILWRKRVIDAITITAKPRSALVELEVIVKAWTTGARFKQVGVPYYPRLHGRAKGANPSMILVTLGEIVRLWWNIKIAQYQPLWFLAVLILSIGVSAAVRFLYIPHAVVCWDEAVALLWTYAVHAAIRANDIPLLMQFLSQQFFYPPLFSVFLSIPLIPFTFTIEGARTAGLVWFVLASLGTYMLGRSIIPGKYRSAGGFIASVLFLTSPMMLTHASIALREMIAVVWSLAAMALYLWARRDNKPWKYLAASLPLIAIAGIKYQYLVVFIGGFGIEALVSVIFLKKKLETIINHLYLFLPVGVILLFWIFYPADRWDLFVSILINKSSFYMGTGGRPVMDYLLFHPRAFLYMYSASWIIGVLLLLSLVWAVGRLHITAIRVFFITTIFNLGILIIHTNNIQERYSILVMPYVFILGAYMLITTATRIRSKLLLLLGFLLILIPVGMDLSRLPLYVYAVGSQTLKLPLYNQLDYNDTWFNYDRKTWPKTPPSQSREHPRDVVQFVMENVDLTKRVDFLGRPGEIPPDLWNLETYMHRARNDYPKLPHERFIVTVDVLPYSRYNTKEFQLLNAWRIKEIREVETDPQYRPLIQKVFEELGIKVTVFVPVI